MTEEEAKTKACCGPVGLIQAVMLHAASRANIDIKVSHCCAGSKCMAWRRSDGLPDSGYCGLAGKP